MPVAELVPPGSLRDPEGPARGGVGPIVSFKTEMTEPLTRSEIFQLFSRSLQTKLLYQR